MSWGDTLTGWFGKSSDQTKQSTGTTTGTDNRYSNFANDPRFQGFVGNYFQQAGQSGPMNQWQTAGLNGLQGAQQYIQPGAQTSANIAQWGTQPFDVNPWYNSNVNNVVNATRGEFDYRNALENSKNKAFAAQQSALTGSGAGNMRAQTQYAQHAAQDPIVAQAFYNAQKQAQDAAFQNTGQRLAAAGQGASNLNAITNWGNQLTQQGLEWWKAPWQRELAYTGQLSNVINPYGTTGTSSGQTTGYSQQNTQDHPSLAQVLGNIGQFGLSFMADGGAVPGFDLGGALGAPRLPSWMGGPNPSGGQPDATPFGADLSAPLGAPMGMPATGNAMPQAQAPNITGAPMPPGKAPSLAPPPAPVAAPPLGAPPPVAPAPPAPSAPPLGAPLGAPLGQPQAGSNAPPGAATQTAAVQPQPSLAKNWMNMAQGGAVGAAGDGHISGFADKVMHATRMFKEMKKELGGRVEAQPQGFGGGGMPWNIGKPVENAEPLPGEDLTPAPTIGPWDTTTTKYEQAPQQQGFASKLSSGWDKFGKGMGWNDPQQQKPGAPQGEQDDFGHKALAQMLQALAQRGQPARAAADGGRIGYARGGVEDDGSGSFLDTISGYLPEFKLKGYYVGDKPTPMQNLGSMVGGLGSLDVQGSANKMQENTRENMLAQARAAEIWDKISGMQYLPTGPQGAMAPTASDKPSFAAQKEAGDLGPIYGKPTPTVHSRATATQELIAPYTALQHRNEALNKDPALMARRLAATQKVYKNEPLTPEDIAALSMTDVAPYPAFPGQPGAVGNRTQDAGSPGSGQPTSGLPPRPPTMAGAPPPAPVAPAGTPPPAGPAGVTPGRTGGLPPAIPQATPAPTPQQIADRLKVVTTAPDAEVAKINWDAVVNSDPVVKAQVDGYFKGQNVPMPTDPKAAAQAYILAQRPAGAALEPGRSGAPAPAATTGRRHALAEDLTYRNYGTEDQQKQHLLTMLDPSRASTIAHDPAQAQQIELAKLQAKRIDETLRKAPVGMNMVDNMDSLKQAIIKAGPDVTWWATGPWLHDPKWNRLVASFATADSNVGQGKDLNMKINHEIDGLAVAYGQLVGGHGAGAATDSARDTLKSAVGEAFKSKGAQGIFDVLHRATVLIQQAAHLKPDEPKESFYPQEWLAKGVEAGPNYQPKNTPPGLMQELRKPPATRDEIPPQAMADLFKMGVNADGSLNKPIIDFFNETFNKGPDGKPRPGLAERLLYPDRP